MIIIADAHVRGIPGNDSEFFDMLAALEDRREDIVFLGDIFDVWIALPGYEREVHRRFLRWCRIQKRFRSVGFIEGNREYFVARERRDSFSWCSEGMYRQVDTGNLFCHGDQVNRHDRNYRRFRKIAKSGAARLFLRVFPLGPRLVEMIKVYSKQTNIEFRKALPHDELKRFADAEFEKGVRRIFVGHFHRSHHYRASEDRQLHTLPSWMGTGMVTFCDEAAGRIRHLNWRELQVPVS